jgi:hypothetical protein
MEKRRCSDKKIFQARLIFYPTEKYLRNFNILGEKGKDYYRVWIKNKN